MLYAGLGAEQELPDNPPMLTTTALALARGDDILLRNIDLSLAPGQVMFIRGQNGIGKTTLLRALCGLMQPEAGQILWKGEALASQRTEFHAQLCYIGHAPAIHDSLSALENLLFLCDGVGLNVPRHAALDALQRIGLGNKLDLPCKVLSQGQRRRVGLARLFLSEAQSLWILDEPFASLDVSAVNNVRAAIESHCTGGGCVVYTSHQEVSFSSPQQIVDLEAYTLQGTYRPQSPPRDNA